MQQAIELILTKAGIVLEVVGSLRGHIHSCRQDMTAQ